MVRVQTVTAVRVGTERLNAYTKRDIENPDEYLSLINFRGNHVIKASTKHTYIYVCVSKEQRI